MQRPDEAKRRAIMEAAAELFATRPFHEVRLDDIAEAACVGKGTLYVYFASKENLYDSLVLEGFDQLLERLARLTATPGETALDTLALIVRELVAWAKHSPHFFQLTRPGEQHRKVPGLKEKRGELIKLIEATIRRGVRDGELEDPRPDLTAQFIPSCVRGAIRFGPRDVAEETLANHLVRVIGGGIVRKRA